ncbi:SRPBCC family protein [Exiguobacterium algae]|uniref:SRPBCC family protein n=1 Tax=Exiguobacterium algae TaxID=2751250 RepID=UPI001BEC5CF6|nr:SRPBCC domain-containing protein [Exiguobacterium algae]
MSTVKSHVEGTTLVIERIFNAPRQLVFEAFSTPAHLEAWWGPAGWKTDVHAFEFKPGGIWHYCMTCIDKEQGDFYGMESWGKSTFIDIDPYARIVYTDAFSDASGHVNPDMPVMTITNEFVETPEGTLLISRSELPDEKTLKQIIDMGSIEGYSSQLDRLDAILSQ